MKHGGKLPSLDDTVLRNTYLAERQRRTARMHETKGAPARVYFAAMKFIKQFSTERDEHILNELYLDLFRDGWMERLWPDRDLIAFAQDAALANFYGLEKHEKRCYDFTYANGSVLLHIPPADVFLYKHIPTLTLAE